MTFYNLCAAMYAHLQTKLLSMLLQIYVAANPLRFCLITWRFRYKMKTLIPYAIGTRIIAIPARASRTVEELAKEKEIYMFNQLPKNDYSRTDALLKCDGGELSR